MEIDAEFEFVRVCVIVWVAVDVPVKVGVCEGACVRVPVSVGDCE
jgi:hypothetical protein